MVIDGTGDIQCFIQHKLYYKFLKKRYIEMDLQAKHVFIFNFITGIIFGLGFMFIPDMIMTMLGFSGEADGPTAFRFFGITVFGVSILCFLIRNEESSNTRQAIIKTQIINLTLINIFLLIFGDLTNLMLWSTVFLHILMIIAYGYILFKK